MLTTYTPPGSIKLTLAFNTLLLSTSIDSVSSRNPSKFSMLSLSFTFVSAYIRPVYASFTILLQQMQNSVLAGWLVLDQRGIPPPYSTRLVLAHRCFSYIKDWVAKKVRRHLMRARQRKGFGWGRWSRRDLYEKIKLYNDYQIRYHKPSKATTA